MTILFTILAIILVLVLGALCLPRRVTVQREADSSTACRSACLDQLEGSKPLTPTAQLTRREIEPFGPATGVGSGFRFQGKEGKGTQTVTAVTDTSVTHLIDLGSMGKPLQTFTVTPNAGGSRVVWSVTSDMGLNPIFRIFGLFMDRMLGKTYELGLRNMANQG